MSRLHRHCPSPAMAVALVALFIAIGGTSYAAIKLPANSVGTKQLKSGAVTSAKVKDGALRAKDFAVGQIPAGRQGLPGPQGQKGDKGDTGAQGPPGISGIYVNLNQIDVQPGATGFVNVNCDVDPSTGLYDIASGGGAFWLGSDPGGPLLESYADMRADGAPSGWRARATNQSASVKTLLAETICVY